MKIFGREPALILGFTAALVKLLGYQFNVGDGTQTAINVTAAAIVGFVLAIVAHNGAWAAALIQLAQAAMSLIVGLGLHWSADKQALIMATIAAGLALWERTQITAPLPTTALEQSSPYKGLQGV